MSTLIPVSHTVNARRRPAGVTKWKAHLLAAAAKKPAFSYQAAIEDSADQFRLALEFFRNSDDSTALQKKLLTEQGLPLLETLINSLRRSQIIPRVSQESEEVRQ
jgi:hypothetical protein